MLRVSRALIVALAEIKAKELNLEWVSTMFVNTRVEVDELDCLVMHLGALNVCGDRRSQIAELRHISCHTDIDAFGVVI